MPRNSKERRIYLKLRKNSETRHYLNIETVKNHEKDRKTTKNSKNNEKQRKTMKNTEKPRKRS
jgi:hypothetical protein